ncbi:Post-GPI attachment to proteins factor 3 [Quaeritorhiza haematococci]|nr:Post-GPI attachment to proteins factor 3 [Quaeritorhiza haematococci]
MHQVTATHIMEGERIHQYYGKWPFIRLWGLQEPASVLFSILNFWAHYKGLLRLRRQIPERYFMLHFYKMHSYLALNAWVWSTVFHARDRPWTEKFDYFSAMLYILFSAYQGFVRVFHIRSIAGLTGLTGLTALGYLAHVTYLSFWPFDYTYNMVAGVVVGVASNIMWIGWCLKNWRTRPYAWKMLLSIVLISSAMSLELLDFPPIWFVFDAHSLWHAATVPVVFIFYDFLVSDSLHEMRLKKGKQAIR